MILRQRRVSTVNVPGSIPTVMPAVEFRFRRVLGETVGRDALRCEHRVDHRQHSGKDAIGNSVTARRGRTPDATYDVGSAVPAV